MRRLIINLFQSFELGHDFSIVLLSLHCLTIESWKVQASVHAYGKIVLLVPCCTFCSLYDDTIHIFKPQQSCVEGIVSFINDWRQS